MGSITSNTLYKTGFVILGSSFFISGLLFAQTYSGFGNRGTALPARSNLNTVISKENFKASVNNLGQQNQQAIRQQIINSLPKSSIGSRPSNSGANPMQPPAAPQIPDSSAYSSQAMPTQTTSPTQPNAPASNSGVYSGFGAGSAPASSSKPSTNSQNSGWNINY